jgi:uncharacterized protein (DUF2252 family)
MTIEGGPLASPADRAAVGRAARLACPRSGHAGWQPAAERPDPVAILDAQAATRVPELVPIRNGRMLASPFAFFRGAAAVMAADLATTTDSGLRVQLCGDAHLGNFGGFRSPERALIFDINDFDETLPGPWEWDVKRLAASLAILGRDRGLPRAERRRLIMATVRQYRKAMAAFAGQRDLAVWYARLDVSLLLARWEAEFRSKTVRTQLLLRTTQSESRDHLGAFAKLTHMVDGRPRIVSRPPLLVPVEELLPDRVEWAEATFREGLRRYIESLPDERRHLLSRFQYAHFARKVVGVGSVGTRAWIALLIGRDLDDPLILQFKEAQPSVLARYVGGSRYAEHGRRVVEGQRLLQAATDTFLGWVRATSVDGVTGHFYVRQLWDGKINPDLTHMSPSMLRLYGEMCGWTLARAHARSGDRVAIAAYLGTSERFDAAIADFAETYAKQNARDHTALAAAVKSGRIPAEAGI